MPQPIQQLQEHELRVGIGVDPQLDPVVLAAALFDEWRAQVDGKQPSAIAKTGGQPLAFAGLWEGWRSLEGEVLGTFVILTTDGQRRDAPGARPHARGAATGAWAVWLGEEEGNVERLMRPAPDGTLRLWPVSRDVNSPRHDRPDLVDPVELPDAPRDDGEAGPDSA